MHGSNWLFVIVLPISRVSISLFSLSITLSVLIIFPPGRWHFPEIFQKSFPAKIPTVDVQFLGKFPDSSNQICSISASQAQWGWLFLAWFYLRELRWDYLDFEFSQSCSLTWNRSFSLFPRKRIRNRGNLGFRCRVFLVWIPRKIGFDI